MGIVNLLFASRDVPGIENLDVYEAHGGYQGLRNALKMERSAIIDTIKVSGLRGRGGAGVPTALKWSGVPKNTDQPHYVICNADEGEPGTYKDRELMLKAAHTLVEGMIIGGYATYAQKGYIYIRGEYMEPAWQVRKAIDQAYKAGYLGKNILGSGFDFDLYLHMGAGSYECGEETALMSSLMGERGMPRLKFPHAPFPVVKGVWDKPTLIHNVESYDNVPFIIDRGAEWWASIGATTKNSRGTKIFSVSGHVNKPGNYEIEFGTPLRELIALAGGPRGKLKCCIPGGSSMPCLNAEDTEKAVLAYDELFADFKTMVGSGGCMVLNDQTCMVTFAWRTAQFYANESCGKCTPCREGTRWLVQILDRILKGIGRPSDIDLLKQVCAQIDGRSFCPLGDAAAWPIAGFLRVFPEEFEYFINHGRSIVSEPIPVPA